MARIRTIKPEFWTSAQVMECSPNARLLFIGMWNFCDDHGRHPSSAKQIKALIFPADDFSSSIIQGMIDELVRNGLLLPYEVEGKGYLQVTGWHHQKIDKRQDPKYPPVPDVEPDLFGERSSNGIDGKERKGRESRGREGNPSSLRSEGCAPASSDDAPKPGPAIDPPPAKRAKRLTAGFKPTSTMIEHARSQGLTDQQIGFEAAKMRDWSLSAQNGACLDWEARWRNWIAKSTPPARAGPNGLYDKGL